MQSRVIALADMLLPLVAARLTLARAAILNLALLCLGVMLLPAARAQEPLSPPIVGTLGDPIYAESTQNGPSTSLIEGDNSLTNPFVRRGISDPLGFLIETGSMSPFLLLTTVNGSVNPYLQTQIINDSTIAERLSEYRENRLLMSSAGSVSLLHGRAAGVGVTASGSARPQTNASSTLAFGGGSTRALFAAGSSGLAPRQTEGAAGVIDPNAMLAANTSSTALSLLQSGPSISSGAAASGASIDTGDSSASSVGAINFPLSMPMGASVPPPTGTATGPQPGSIFPNPSFPVPSSTGFMDATRGTAGLVTEGQGNDGLHSLAPRADPADSPFRALGIPGGTGFLNPSLQGGDSGGTLQLGAGQDVKEFARKARLHAMIYNPGAAPPNAFEERKIERDYKRQSSGRRASRYPASNAPSIRP